MTEEARRGVLAAEAEKLAETGRTLQDVLRAITESGEPADQETARRIAEIVKQTRLDEAVDAMQQTAGQIRNGKLDQAQLSALDSADRLEIVGQRLDSTYQAIVAPQADALMKAERALAALRDRQDELETPAQVVAWHRDVGLLLERLEELGINTKLREAIREEFRKSDWGTAAFQKTIRSWAIVDGVYGLPEAYDRVLVLLQDKLQTRIQTLILADLDSAADETTPPVYRDLVYRYLKVLSEGRK